MIFVIVSLIPLLSYADEKTYVQITSVDDALQSDLSRLDGCFLEQ